MVDLRVPGKPQTAQHILAQTKGLQNHLAPNEEPLLVLPGIWDGGRSKSPTPCDIVLTSERLFGFYEVRFPRERIFLDGLQLETISHVSLRQKSYDILFRELMVSNEQRKVYIRAPRAKIEELYTVLRSTIERYAPSALSALEDVPERPALVYGRQDILTPFESSLLAIALLFVGGICLELLGAALWMIQGAQVGSPLCLAGFVAVTMALILRRRKS